MKKFITDTIDNIFDFLHEINDSQGFSKAMIVAALLGAIGIILAYEFLYVAFYVIQMFYYAIIAFFTIISPIYIFLPIFVVFAIYAGYIVYTQLTKYKR